MSNVLAAMTAILPSLAALALLAWRDAKRLRSLSRRVALQAWSVPQRRLLASTILLPGAVLMLAGLWPGFLLWAGALLAAGWLLVMLQRA